MNEICFVFSIIKLHTLNARQKFVLRGNLDARMVSLWCGHWG